MRAPDARRASEPIQPSERGGEAGNVKVQREDAAHLRLARMLFGPQGEGAIEGHSGEYALGSLRSHEYRYSRWRCDQTSPP